MCPLIQRMLKFVGISSLCQKMMSSPAVWGKGKSLVLYSRGTLLPDDRGKAIAIMNKALQAFLSKVQSDGILARVVLSNVAAFAGMVIGQLKLSKESASDNEKPSLGITVFGVTTSCVNAVKDRLAQEGFEILVFHATGLGGRAMEDIVKAGLIQEDTWHVTVNVSMPY